ncbi:MAG: YbaB/EbfC family nucleoid-associated protein [Sphingobacteriaceae bacterium]|nr:YbaB/EbfC family nucleoid-associated protein [Sphingobacteriaceae bacterium]
MFGKMGDMMGKLQEMKKKADEIKIKLDNTVLHAEGASGDIKIEITGNRKINSITISPALQHGDTAVLEQELKTTINNAILMANVANEDEMKKATAGLLPGM